MNTPENLALLRAAVATKIAYWDALHALEVALTPNGEFSSKANDAVAEQIELLASGIDTAEQLDQITDEHLLDTIEMAGKP